MTKLERSDDFFRKLSFLQVGDVPTQTEIKDRLGEVLTNALFETADASVKPHLGLEPTLKGPGDDLWVSPSDLLIGKVKLKPPLTSKHIQALAHQGIMEIGQMVEVKFWNEHELDKQKALAESEDMLKYFAEKEKKQAVEEAIVKEKVRCECTITELKKDFLETLQRELKVLEERMEMEKEMAVMQARLEIEELMQKKVEDAITITVEKLTDRFALALQKQSEKLHEHFRFHLRVEQNRLRKAVAEEKMRSEEQLMDLKQELACENAANVMYVLCNERKRCQCEKKIRDEKHQAEIIELQEQLVETNEKLEIATKESEYKSEKIVSREKALFEIIKQFQKFIYFVLRAVPMQAEYLLNIEKLMVFELTKTVMETKPELFLGNPLFFYTRNYRPPSQETTSPSETVATKGSSQDSHNPLVVKDYHNCRNKEVVEKSAHTLASSADLPGFVYNEQVYVREDFRNMVSQGLHVSQSNELWNYDIEDLTELLHRSKANKTTSLKASEPKDMYSGKRMSNASVRFSSSKKVMPLDSEEELQDFIYEKKEEIYGTSCKTREEFEREKKMRESDMDYKKETSEKRQKKNIRSASDPQIVIRRPSDEPSSDSIKSVESIKLKVHSSKLVSVKDSLILHMSRFQGIKIPGSSIAKPLKMTKVPRRSSLKTKEIPIKRHPSSIRNHRDSLIINRSKISQIETSVPYLVGSSMTSVSTEKSVQSLITKALLSKLSVARDSLELAKKSRDQIIKESSPKKISIVKGSLSKRSTLSSLSGADSVELFSSYLDKLQGREWKNKSTQCDKSVKISHFEIIPQNNKIKSSTVLFRDGSPKIIYDDYYSHPLGDSEDLTSESGTRENFLTKRNVLAVMGDREQTEHIQEQEEFTIKRVNSFVKILNRHPSLRKMFIN